MVSTRVGRPVTSTGGGDELWATLREDGGNYLTITWSGGDTTQQRGDSIQKTKAFNEFIASKGIKKGPAIKKPS